MKYKFCDYIKSNKRISFFSIPFPLAGPLGSEPRRIEMLRPYESLFVSWVALLLVVVLDSLQYFSG
jgi:hypothetical protein